MKRWAAVVLCLVWMIAGTGVVSAVEVSARSAIVMEQSTGRVLWEENADEVLAMASTTKIMTALCVLENATLDEVVCVTKEMSGIEGSSMYLEVGEELTVEQLLQGLMLRSGNDAAVALAVHVGGSVAGFVEVMNEKAAELGLEHTRFANPHGLPAEGHYTTARELAVITCAAYENADFCRIVSTERAVVPWKGHEYDRAMANKNKLLKSYEGANGVKTGYTKAAGRCLVSGAMREGMQVVAVALNAPDMWTDCAQLMDSAFEEYDMVQAVREGELLGTVACVFSEEGLPVVAGESVSLPMKAGEAADVTLHLPKNIEAGVARGEQIGYANVEAVGTPVRQVPLLAAREMQPERGWKWKQALRKVADGWFIQVDAG